MHFFKYVLVVLGIISPCNLQMLLKLCYLFFCCPLCGEKPQMLQTLLWVGSLLQSLPLCSVASLVDLGEEVVPALQVWMCSPRSLRSGYIQYNRTQSKRAGLNSLKHPQAVVVAV